MYPTFGRLRESAFSHRLIWRSGPLASIFLSYAREDLAKAQRVAKALEAVGHSVWWDRQLRPGERFSAEIDKALKSADAVVALWSKASIESAWVQDEASVGRDSGRLVPALLERVTPPLGFRQYHAVDISRGRLSARSTGALVQAVEDRVSGKRAVANARVRSAALHRKILLGLVALIGLAATGAGWWFLRPGGAVSTPSIVLGAAEGNSPMAELLARSIAHELGRFRAGPLAGLDIEQGKGRNTTYQARVGVVESPSELTLQISLASNRAANLWATSLEAASSQGAELNRQAAAMLGAALQCDLDLEKRNYRLGAEVRALYVDGCARMADLAASRNEAINAFRQVTQKAPRFAPGWAHLAYAEFSGIQSVPESETSNLAWSAGRHIDTARSLDPNLPEVFYVRAFDKPLTSASSSDALKILDEGLHRNPQSAILHNGRADVLLNVGRVREGLQSAERAAALDPLSPALLENRVMALVYAGQAKGAERELENAESNWRRSAAIAMLRYKFDLRYGDPANALRMLREDEVPDLTQDESTELFLRARTERTAANVEAALQSYRKAFEKDWWNVMAYVQALAEFGRIDEAYRAFEAAPAEAWYGNGNVLFRPFMRGIRDEPRFMRLAYRAGLLSFWRKSGVWPDFCRDPKLPYDCRKEAMKYPLEPPKS
jgi:tetratricopeptide (TPR) repeat protein